MRCAAVRAPGGATRVLGLRATARDRCVALAQPLPCPCILPSSAIACQRTCRDAYIPLRVAFAKVAPTSVASLVLGRSRRWHRASCTTLDVRTPLTPSTRPPRRPTTSAMSAPTARSRTSRSLQLARRHRGGSRTHLLGLHTQARAMTTSLRRAPRRYWRRGGPRGRGSPGRARSCARSPRREAARRGRGRPPRRRRAPRPLHRRHHQ